MRPDPYRPLSGFAAPARARPELWRTLAGLALTGVAGLGLYHLALNLLATLLGPAAMADFLDEVSFRSGSVLSAVVTLASFGFFALGLAMMLPALHRRSLPGLIGQPDRAGRDFLRVLGAVGLLMLALAVLLPQAAPPVANPRMPPGRWLGLLPLSLTVVLIQSATEELVFRGYLLQQIAMRWPGRRAWLVLPAALFAAGHWAPGGGSVALWLVAWAFCFGLATADLTARSGTLGAAAGFHMAVNTVALLVLSLAGPGSGLALWLVPVGTDSPAFAATLWTEFAALGLAWLAARLALRV